MTDNETAREIFDFLKKELKGGVGTPYLEYLERKYKKKRESNDKL